MEKKNFKNIRNSKPRVIDQLSPKEVVLAEKSSWLSARSMEFWDFGH